MIIRDIIIKNASGLNNSYSNLYLSAKEVQQYIENPEIMKALNGVYEVICSEIDDIMLEAIDAAAFEGAPISQVCCTALQIYASGLKDSQYIPYFKYASNIADIDNYVFIQKLAENCFEENEVECDNRYYSYILCLKASLTAYIANDSDEHKRTDLKYMLSDAISANREYYRTSYNDAPDLRELLGENTDMSKLEDFNSKVQISSEWQFGRLVKNEETLIFTKWEYNSDNFSIVEQDIKSGRLNTLVSAKRSGSKSTPDIALVGNHLYYTDKNGINLYNLETKSTELKWSGENCGIIGINETEQNLILQEEYDGKYYVYNVSNDECQEIIDLNKFGLLTTDGDNIYYYTNDDKIGSEFDEIAYTHIYKCEIATGVTSELTAIAINGIVKKCAVREYPKSWIGRSQAA